MGRKKKKIGCGIGLFFALCVVVAIVLGFVFVGSVLDEISGEHAEKTSVTVTVEKGDTTAKIAQKLVDLGVIQYPKIFEYIAKFDGADKTMQIGTFQVVPGASYADLFDILSQVKTYRASVRITFPEGCEVNDFIAKLTTAGVGTEEAYRQAMADMSFDYDYIPEPGTENRLEGFLFPDTYDFFTDETAENVIRKLVGQFHTKLILNKIPEKADALGMSVYEVITLASIIQKEGQGETEMPIISSVFHNRLAKPMKLQSCATVNYILPVEDRKWILTNADMAIKSPYNTYLNDGLTPTPICSPGVAAIVAAAEPAETEYYYFCGKGDGTHAFAKTYAEHEANCKRYLR